MEGENTFCIGKENGKNLYKGFESGIKTENEMRELLKKKYDSERSPGNRNKIIKIIKDRIGKKGITIPREEEYWLEYAEQSNKLLDEWILDQYKKYSNSLWLNIYLDYHSNSHLVPQQTTTENITITYIARPII